MLIRGRCHCGNLSFLLDWKPQPREIPARACGCTFCVKHGGRTSCPAGGGCAVSVRGASSTTGISSAPRRGFQVCRGCGWCAL
jgi:hypothetical protein